MAKPNKCITVAEAKALQNKWKETRAIEIEKGQGYKDTREVWYSLQELQDYIDYVREESLAQGVKRPGIRIYFGADEGNSEKKSYATVFLAPTKEKSNPIEEDGDAVNNENNYEIDPQNDGTVGWPPINY